MSATFWQILAFVLVFLSYTLASEAKIKFLEQILLLVDIILLLDYDALRRKLKSWQSFEKKFLQYFSQFPSFGI
jgi:hypothetical protein